ncbi:hypothetical protein WR25_04916 [Diploscapter pachys]|uniref:Uncharacterized protein n=1 Tax=Diploscapter pachys TaxID=2018661 RepID=A0A2A2KFB7_9BILA|nr:hypothetical protein WR25_04916 [Diploscapter pachys]
MEIDNAPPFPAPQAAAPEAVAAAPEAADAVPEAADAVPEAADAVPEAAAAVLEVVAVPAIQPAADVDAQLTPLAAVLPVRMPVPGNPIYNRHFTARVVGFHFPTLNSQNVSFMVIYIQVEEVVFRVTLKGREQIEEYRSIIKKGSVRT